MISRKHRPSWWQLWRIFPVLGILAFLEARTSLSPAGHRAVEVGMVLIIFALVSVWLNTNRAALLREMGDHYMVSRESGLPAGLPLEPGAIAGGNGNGHKSGWILAGRRPEPIAADDDREEEW